MVTRRRRARGLARLELHQIQKLLLKSNQLLPSRLDRLCIKMSSTWTEVSSNHSHLEM
jgi:hypothetical protein